MEKVTLELENVQGSKVFVVSEEDFERFMRIVDKGCKEDFELYFTEVKVD